MSHCTCRQRFAGPADIDPPEPIRDPHCPEHGTPIDPSDAYHWARDDGLVHGLVNFSAED